MVLLQICVSATTARVENSWMHRMKSRLRPVALCRQPPSSPARGDHCCSSMPGGAASSRRSQRRHHAGCNTLRWLLSLGKMLERFTGGAAGMDGSFLFTAEQYFLLWIQNSVSVQLQKDIWVISSSYYKSSPMIICVKVFVETYIFTFLGELLTAGIDGNCKLTFLRNCHCLSEWLCHFAFCHCGLVGIFPPLFPRGQVISFLFICDPLSIPHLWHLSSFSFFFKLLEFYYDGSD